MILGVSGCRSFRSPTLATFALQWMIDDAKEFGYEVSAVHVGDCPSGVDLHVRDWAERHQFPHEVHRADWANEGRKAGPRRNRKLVEASDALLAIWDGKSRGTRSAIQLAVAAKIPIVIFYTPGGWFDDLTVWRMEDWNVEVGR